MPDFSALTDVQDSGYGQADLVNATQHDMQQGAALTGGGNHNWLTTLAGDSALGALDLVDTVASSIPGVSRAAGIQRGQVNNAVLGALDMPGLADFYNQNKEGVQVASGIAGIIAAEIATRKFTAVAAPFVQGLKSVPFARSMVTLDSKYAEAMAAVRQVDTGLARSGITGAEAWTTQVPVRTGVVSEVGPSMGNIFSTTRSKAALKAGAAKFLVGAKDAAKVEATMATFLNQNQFLYSDDTGQNMMWMGLGVATGGVLSALGSGYAMRKFTNSDTLRRIRAEALDPTGQEAARNAIPDASKTGTFLGSLRGWASDRVTSLMVNAKAAPLAGVDSTSANRLSSQFQSQAFEELNKVTNKGLHGIDGSAFSTGAQGFWNHVTGTLDKDPGMMYGVEMAGGIGENMGITSTHAELTQKVQSRLDDLGAILAEHDSGAKPLTDKQRVALLTEKKNLAFQQQLTPMVLMDNELMPLSHGQIYDNWAEPNISKQTLGKDSHLYEAMNPGDGKSFKVGIESDGTLHLPKVGRAMGTLDNIDHFDMLRLYRAGNNLVTDLARRVGDPNFKWIVPFEMQGGKPTYNWFHLDMAQELLKRTNGRAQIDWGILSPEAAQKESLLQKIQGLKAVKPDMYDADTVNKLRLRYNLPRLNAYQMGVLGQTDTPLDVLVRGAMQMPESQLSTLSVDDLKNGFAQANNIGDLSKINSSQVDSLAGNSFNFMRDSQNQITKPILMYKRPIAVRDLTQDMLAERIGAKKTAIVTQLMGPQSGPLTREMTQQIMASPDYALGAQTTGLMDTQIASSIPGVANIPSQTAAGSILNSVVTSEWRARDNPVILAVTRLREGVERMMGARAKQVVEQAFGDSLATLNGPRNAASKLLLDNFHTFRPGWDLEKDAIPSAINSQHSTFVLADTQANKARFKQQFQREMPQGQTLLDSKGNEVALDALGLDAQKRYNAVTDVQRIEKNSLLRAQGLPEISSSEWYTAPPNLQGKYVGFTFDSSGNIVPGGTIIAGTQEAFSKELSRMRADSTSVLNSVPDAAFRNRDEIQEFSSIWDKAQMELMNPGTTATQGGKSARGYLTGAYANVNTFDDAMRGLRDTFMSHADDIVQTMLDDQIKSAKARSNIASGVTRNADSKQIKYRSVYDYWLEAAQGRGSLSSNGSAVGWLYNGAETRFNDLMRQASPTANRVWQGVSDWVGKRMPWQAGQQARQDFEALATKLGAHMPFDSAAEMLERKSLGASPYKLADLTGAGNRFTATWMLRMLEPAAAVMNLSGVLNAMPAVIRNISARDGESAVDLAARVGHNANIFSGPDGRVFSSLDMGKLAWNGFKRAWNKTSDADFHYMQDNGFISQEVAEFQRQFNSVEDRGSLSRFLNGDPNSKNQFAKRGMVGWLSVLTDKSEDFSRSWAHMIGLEAADMIGIEAADTVGKHNFAHDIANKMIANYSPHNRPEIFQGAIGAPIGLFQSFMWAYYQRMFRYAETGDARSLATQFALQGTLYGAPSVPGFSQLNQLFFDHSDGKSSPYDALYSKFGQSGGDMLMAGTLSNMPKLFGMEGVNLFSRGDVSPQIVTQNPVTHSAAVSTFTKIMQGIGEGISLFSSQNPSLNSQQIGEVLSNMIPNRPIAGFIEQAMANGYDTDAHGNVVSQSKNWMDATYRMIGLRSLSQAKELEAFYGNKQAMEIKAGQDDQFRTELKGAIRGGDYDSIPKFMAKYVENGGDPAQVRRMLRSAYSAAVNSRGVNQLNDAMHSPAKAYQVQRLLNAQVGIDDDADTPDPTQVYGMNDPMDSEQPQATEDANSMAYGIQ